MENSGHREPPLAVIRVLYGMRRFFDLMRIRHTVSGWRSESRKRSNVDVSLVDVSPDMEHSVTARRGTYAGFYRGDMTAAEPLEARIEWTEPGEFPRRGTYHGRDGVKVSDAAPCRWGRGRQRAVYHVDAGVRPKGRNHWQDVSLADVYTFRNGRVVEMQAFAGRREALRWVGAEAERVR
jgi:ketosteroid isomerase-like protein